MLAKFYLKKRCKKGSCPITLHISTPAYKHMRLYSVDINQSVTKSLRFKITVMPLLVLQITVGMPTFLIKLLFVSPLHVWNTWFRAKFTQIIIIPCLVFTTYHTVWSLICSTLPKHVWPVFGPFKSWTQICHFRSTMHKF